LSDGNIELSNSKINDVVQSTASLESNMFYFLDFGLMPDSVRRYSTGD